MNRLAVVVLAGVPLLALDVRAGEPEAFAYSVAAPHPLKLHVFRPETPARKKQWPAVLIFHGGGWAYGSAEWAFPRARHFAERGFVGIAVEYRLSDQKSVTPLDAVTDAQEAVRWTRANAKRLRIDPDRIVAYGWSAGGHLAASAAIFDTSAGKKATPDALVLVSPAVSLEKDGWFSRLLLDRATVEEVDPASHVRKGLPPTIILQGDVDTVTPLAGVREFCDRLRRAGTRCDLEVFEGFGHLFTPAGIPDDGDPKPDAKTQAAASARIDAFLSQLGYSE